MSKIYFSVNGLIVLVFFVISSYGQSDSDNYQKTIIPTVAISNEANVSGLSFSNAITVVTYLDGLGNEIQTNQRHASSDGQKDLISTTTYDVMGRVEKQYLPFAKANNGAYEADFSTPANWSSYYVGEEASKAASILRYRSGFHTRVFEQETPGQDAPALGRYEYDYGSNNSDEVLYFYVGTDGELLKVAAIWQENWQRKRPVVEILHELLSLKTSRGGLFYK